MTITKVAGAESAATQQSRTNQGLEDDFGKKMEAAQPRRPAGVNKGNRRQAGKNRAGQNQAGQNAASGPAAKNKDVNSGAGDASQSQAGQSQTAQPKAVEPTKSEQDAAQAATQPTTAASGENNGQEANAGQTTDAAQSSKADQPVQAEQPKIVSDRSLTERAPKANEAANTPKSDGVSATAAAEGSEASTQTEPAADMDTAPVDGAKKPSADVSKPATDISETNPDRPAQSGTQALTATLAARGVDTDSLNAGSKELLKTRGDAIDQIRGDKFDTPEDLQQSLSDDQDIDLDYVDDLQTDAGDALDGALRKDGKIQIDSRLKEDLPALKQTAIEEVSEKTFRDIANSERPDGGSFTSQNKDGSSQGDFGAEVGARVDGGMSEKDLALFRSGEAKDTASIDGELVEKRDRFAVMERAVQGMWNNADFGKAQTKTPRNTRLNEYRDFMSHFRNFATAYAENSNPAAPGGKRATAIADRAQNALQSFIGNVANVANNANDPNIKSTMRDIGSELRYIGNVAGARPSRPAVAPNIANEIRNALPKIDNGAPNTPATFNRDGSAFRATLNNGSSRVIVGLEGSIPTSQPGTGSRPGFVGNGNASDGPGNAPSASRSPLSGTDPQKERRQTLNDAATNNIRKAQQSVDRALRVLNTSDPSTDSIRLPAQIAYEDGVAAAQSVTTLDDIGLLNNKTKNAYLDYAKNFSRLFSRSLDEQRRGVFDAFGKSGLDPSVGAPRISEELRKADALPENSGVFGNSNAIDGALIGDRFKYYFDKVSGPTKSALSRAALDREKPTPALAEFMGITQKFVSEQFDFFTDNSLRSPSRQNAEAVVDYLGIVGTADRLAGGQNWNPWQSKIRQTSNDLSRMRSFGVWAESVNESKSRPIPSLNLERPFVPPKSDGDDFATGTRFGIGSGPKEVPDYEPRASDIRNKEGVSIPVEAQIGAAAVGVATSIFSGNPIQAIVGLVPVVTGLIDVFGIDAIGYDDFIYGREQSFTIKTGNGKAAAEKGARDAVQFLRGFFQWHAENPDISSLHPRSDNRPKGYPENAKRNNVWAAGNGAGWSANIYREQGVGQWRTEIRYKPFVMD